MSDFRFSPIRSRDELLTTIQYVAENTTKLCQKVIGRILPISSLTVFSHYPDEFENLDTIVRLMGPLITYNNGPYVNLAEPILLPTGKLTKLRVRHPDPERPQVGCNDFGVDDYHAFKSEYLEQHPNNLRLVIRPEYEMIEFFDKDFDVLAYVVSKHIV